MLIVPLNTKGMESNGIFYGYASVFNVVDHDGDIIVPGAFKQSLEAWAQCEKKPSMLWQHEQSMEIGTWHDMSEDAYGLVVKGQIDLSHSAGRHVYQLMQTGEVKGLSIGFVPIQAVYRRGNRYICDVDLREISVVSEACNRMACITYTSHPPTGNIHA